ncbi:UNVERIFIED_CONTAM: hypothetical protein NY603_19010, partial [Bacteroidetes bacterium 56_B9]
MKSILDRIQADPRLASALMPHRVAQAQLASLRLSPSKKSLNISETELSTRDMTPQSSPSKCSLHPMDALSSSQMQPHEKRSPGKRESSGSPNKLILNPQNPHL